LSIFINGLIHSTRKWDGKTASVENGKLEESKSEDEGNWNNGNK